LKVIAKYFNWISCVCVCLFSDVIYRRKKRGENGHNEQRNRLYRRAYFNCI